MLIIVSLQPYIYEIAHVNARVIIYTPEKVFRHNVHIFCANCRGYHGRVQSVSGVKIERGMAATLSNAVFCRGHDVDRHMLHLLLLAQLHVPSMQIVDVLARKLYLRQKNKTAKMLLLLLVWIA